MQSMPSSTWAATNRRPLASERELDLDLLMSARERRNGRGEIVDANAKWPGAVRLALLAGGVAGSWGALWLAVREVSQLIR